MNIKIDEDKIVEQEFEYWLKLVEENENQTFKSVEREIMKKMFVLGVVAAVKEVQRQQESYFKNEIERLK